MTLKTSGPLSFSELQDEFGGSNPISLSEYRQGGTYVPTGTTNKDGQYTPGSTGVISMGQYYGATDTPYTLSVSALIVGGGGAGGVRYGVDNAQLNGGGGAGGYISTTVNISKGQSFFISIGSGGTAEPIPGSGSTTARRDSSSGGNTNAFGYAAWGGGHGGGSDGRVGEGGGSGGGGPGGGGAGVYPGSTYLSAARQGYDGYYGGGGAGGASTGYDGGPGAQWINGYYYAGGGSSSSGSTFVLGGGGYTFTGTSKPHGGNHATYFGGGGQGGATKFGAWESLSSGYYGGNGYQGIVIVSYIWNFPILTGGGVFFTSLGGTGIYSRRYYHNFIASGYLSY